MIVEEMGDGALTTSERGVVLYANERMAQLLGRDRSSLLGTDVTHLVPPHAVAEAHRPADRAARRHPPDRAGAARGAGTPSSRCWRR